MWLEAAARVHFNRKKGEDGAGAPLGGDFGAEICAFPGFAGEADFGAARIKDAGRPDRAQRVEVHFAGVITRERGANGVGLQKFVEHAGIRQQDIRGNLDPAIGHLAIKRCPCVMACRTEGEKAVFRNGVGDFVAIGANRDAGKGGARATGMAVDGLAGQFGAVSGIGHHGLSAHGGPFERGVSQKTTTCRGKSLAVGMKSAPRRQYCRGMAPA